MNLILVPAWVKQSLEAENLSLKDVLNPESLLATLSKEDVAFYVWLNKHLDRWIPSSVCGSFNTGDKATSFTSQQLSDLSDLMMGFTIRENQNRSKNESSSLDSCELFGPLSAKVSPTDVNFDTCPIDYDTIALVPKKDSRYSLMGMVNDLLLHLNGRLAFHDVAKTPLFRLYLSNV